MNVNYKIIFATLVIIIFIPTHYCAITETFSSNDEDHDGTPGLLFYSMNSENTEYSVARGTAEGTHIVIPSTYKGKPVTRITHDDPASGYPPGGFAGYSTMTSISIPNTITSIGWRAFILCTGLTGVTIPNSVIEIGKDAFAGCISLSEVKFETPSRLSIIDIQVFSRCINLTDINIPDSVISIAAAAFGDCESLTSITLPKNLKTIGAGAFANCTSLTSVTIQSKVKNIDFNPFLHCLNLKAITVAKKNKYYSDAGNCLIRLSDKAIITGLSTTVIPNWVEKINYQSFLGFTDLESLIIPNGVKYLETHPFYGCTNLSSVYIPLSVIRIEPHAFVGFKKLTIYTEHLSKPDKWHFQWNSSNLPVVWGYKR